MKALSSSELTQMAAAFGQRVVRADPRTLEAHISSGSLEEMVSMLPFLPADDARGIGSIDPESTDNWFGMTLAVRRTYGEGAKALYRERCQQSNRYEEVGFDKAWNAFDPNHPNPVTKLSLFALARKHGWTGYSPEPSLDRYKLLSGAAITEQAPIQWRIKG